MQAEVLALVLVSWLVWVVSERAVVLSTMCQSMRTGRSLLFPACSMHNVPGHAQEGGLLFPACSMHNVPGHVQERGVFSTLHALCTGMCRKEESSLPCMLYAVMHNVRP
jgi:hypothetical protein